jgi:GH15 family glucan-1,4-alpha-glucosidase
MERGYRPIADYGMIGDCHGAALVARDGSIDWCCLPRLDSASCFGRLLDRRRGGWFAVAPVTGTATSRGYVDDTLVLETVVAAAGGQARVLDLMPVNAADDAEPYAQVLRIIEGQRGMVEFELQVAPRFDYGASAPRIRRAGTRLFSIVAGDNGLALQSDADLEETEPGVLTGTVAVRAGERVRLAVSFAAPERLDPGGADALPPEALDERAETTVAWWQEWRRRVRLSGPDAPGATRSALMLKALANPRSGAIAAAATTSLPEGRRGHRTWDYRASWVRDATFAARALADVGCEAEADAFAAFIQRTTAGHVEQLQILYGIGGERGVPELEVEALEGWNGIGPVRTGNAAAHQEQNDVYGELVNLTWRWHQRGHSPADDVWRFVAQLAETAATRWKDADRGMWEVRGKPRHFVFSKVMCWAALEYAARLADDGMRRAPVTRWRSVRDEIRDAVESRGYDKRRGIFVQAFGATDLDAGLLRLPTVGFVDWDDERMVRTTDAIAVELDDGGGLLRRYKTGDDLSGREGAFVAGSFWLAECFARQGRTDDARRVFDRALTAGNDLGLFAEEYDSDAGEMLGNFPQALTHLSHIAAALALA